MKNIKEAITLILLAVITLGIPSLFLIGFAVQLEIESLNVNNASDESRLEALEEMLEAE